MPLKSFLNTSKDSHFHLLPGRLRFSVPGLLYNQTMARNIALSLSRVPGIKIGYVNPRSGRVLIYYAEDKIKLRTLLFTVFRIVFRLVNFSNLRRTPLQTNCLKTQQTPNMQKQNQNQNRNKNRPVLVKYPATKAPVANTNPTPNKTFGAVPWHTMENDHVLLLLESSLDQGLPLKVSENRLKIYGVNELAGKPPASLTQLLIEPLKGFMTKLLMLAAGVSIIVGEAADALVIAAIIILQSVIEAYQGYKAEKSLSALKQLSAPTAKVIRDGKITEIQARHLVPGDVIILEPGDRIPADARLLSASNLTTNESCLTGESLPAVKSAEAAKETFLPLGDCFNMVFSGTDVIGGRALAGVTATGMHTEMGKIARLLGQVENEPTLLHKQMEMLGAKISKGVGLAVTLIAVINLAQGRSLFEVLRNGISLAVGAIPEGLPAIVTISLAAGVQRMVRRNAVVRKLSAVETLGSATVICSDKTGTLTKNQMTVKALYTNNKYYQLTGEGYGSDGVILHKNSRINLKTEPEVVKTLKVGVLCNNAQLEYNSQSRNWDITGDPTEAALLCAATKAGLWWKDLQHQFCREKEIAFDSQRRLMTVVCQTPTHKQKIYVKGASEELLACCSQISKNGSVWPLDFAERKQILEANERLAAKGLRVLALAWKEIKQSNENDETNNNREPNLEENLIFAGLIGMEDPPREGVRAAVKKCHRAGIRVVMITGDHEKTATAIAQKLGIMDHGINLAGSKLNKLSEDKLEEIIDRVTVFSRTSPEQKLKIVKTLKKRGHIVVMTGDGVNDAPAVKEAHIGVAMGLAGTDVTREAAGITLSDDNFSTIVAGVEEGRTVGQNLDKSVQYVLGGNVGQVLAIFLSAVAALPTALLPPQILWINLVTEGLPAMALAGDPPAADCMRRPPENPNKSFLDKHGWDIARRGFLTGISTFGVYAGGLGIAGWTLEKARTMAFSHLVMGRVLNIIKVGREKNKEEKNPYILPAAGLSAGALLMTMYLPALRPLFSTIPLGLWDWAVLGITAKTVGKMDSFLVSSLQRRVRVKRKMLSLPTPIEHRKEIIRELPIPSEDLRVEHTYSS